MVNEVILTALRNAISSGESLDTAVQIMINSGYDAGEVQEASSYVSRGVISNLQPQQPQASQQFPQFSIYESQQFPQQPLQSYKQPLPVEQQSISQQQMQQQISTQQPIQKKSYKKEIILVIMLIILLIILGGTIFFKDKILGFLSS